MRHPWRSSFKQSKRESGSLHFQLSWSRTIVTTVPRAKRVRESSTTDSQEKNEQVQIRWERLSVHKSRCFRPNESESLNSHRRLARRVVLLFKLWLNKLALASTCHLVWDLRALALTCIRFDRVQICAQIDASLSFSTFGHPTQVNASIVVYFEYWIAARTGAFWDMRALSSKLASPLGHPTQACT